MHNDQTTDLSHLERIFNALTSGKTTIIEEAFRQIASYLLKNSQDTEDIIERLFQFIKSNLTKLTINQTVKIINKLLFLMENNTMQLIRIMKIFLHNLLKILLTLKLSIEDYNLLTYTIGTITLKCGNHSSQFVESCMDYVFKKCRNEQKEHEYMKYVLITLLKEFIKNSPDIVYNKLIDTFDDFIKVVGYYQDRSEYVRSAVGELIFEFLQLLNNRDNKVKAFYTKKIYSIIEKNIQNGSNSEYAIHGTILVLRALTVRREFFNEKYKLFLSFLFTYIHSKNLLIQSQIIALIPFFGENLKEIFEKFFFGNFASFFIQIYMKKPPQSIKNLLLLSLGKLSVIISKNSFFPFAGEIVNMIKMDFDNNGNITLEGIDCLAKLLVNYDDVVLNKIPFDTILIKIFNCGFYESHVNFLIQLLKVYNDRMLEEIQILVTALNVVSSIISSKKFDSSNCLKNLVIATTQKKSANSGINSNNINNSEKREKKPPPPRAMELSDNFPQDVRNCIVQYIKREEKNKTNFKVKLKQNAILFLKEVTHPFFFKDILTFYQENCIRELDDASKVKLEVIELGTSPWIPQYQSTNDTQIDYMMKCILDSFINYILITQHNNIKLKILKNIDSRYDKLLSEVHFFNKFVLIINSNDYSVKEQIVIIISRLISFNYTIVIYFIKKTLMDVFNTLESSQNFSEKQDSILLLMFFIKYTGNYISDYLNVIFKSLMKLLRSEESEVDTDDSSVDEQEKTSNEILRIQVLSILSDIIPTSYHFNIDEPSYREIISICIDNLKINKTSFCQEISLKTILAILENSEIDWNVYFNFTELVNMLIEILIRTTNNNARLYALKIFGFIGTMDPDKLEVLWSIHRNDAENNTEDYEADEYENFDDEEIVSHNREQMKKRRRAGHYNYKLLLKKSKKTKSQIDFEKKVSKKELDSCTYYSIIALMNILNDTSQMEACTQVIQVLPDIIKDLQNKENERIIVKLILIRLIEVVYNFNGNIQLHILEIIYYIVKNFKTISIEHLPEIVDLIEKFIQDSDVQNTIFSILMILIDKYFDKMENYFNRLVPILINTLPDDDTTQTANVWIIRQKVFQCLSLMKNQLNHYLNIIVPKIVSLLTSSMLLSMNYGTTSNKEIGSGSVTVLKRADMEIFAFINKIIELQKFVDEMPKVVLALVKYMNFCPELKEFIMELFMQMFKHLKNDFLIYLPQIIRTAKNNNLNILNYLGEIREGLELCGESTIYMLPNGDIEQSKREQVIMKSSNDDFFSYDESSQRDISFLLQTQKNRINRISKEEILNEFNPINCSIEEDWQVWFKTSLKQLFNGSPSNVLYYCRDLSDNLRELFNFAFIKVWKKFNQYQKMKMLSYLNTALTSQTTPKEILLIILNLSEFIERAESNTEFISLKKLGDAAEVCNAYAKELYYIENDFKNNNNINSLETLIRLYYELNLPESAMGILKMTQKKNKNIKEDDWYFKFHKWKEALEVIQKKREKDKNNKEYLKGNIVCLDGLGDWESLLALGDEIEEQFKDDKNSLSKLAPFFARASLNLSEWDKLKKYTNRLQPVEDEEEYEKNFFLAMISIKEKEYDKAKMFIENARRAIDDKIKTLLTESYERAYDLLLSSEHLYQLEEVIKFLEYDNNCDSDGMQIKMKMRNNLKMKWDQRLEMIAEEDTQAFERILTIRGLIFPIEEDYDKHLDLAKIFRNDDLFTKYMNLLKRLRKPLENNKNISIYLELCLNKCLFENDSAKDTQKAIDNMGAIIKNEIQNADDRLKSKVYCYYSYLNMHDPSRMYNEAKVNEILNYLELSTKYNVKSYKAWHYYGLLNYKYFDFLLTAKAKKVNFYAQNALNGFINSVIIGGKIISKTLQDLLRLIDVWFRMESTDELMLLVTDSFKKIALDSWLLVIPQLLARINAKDKTIRESLVSILKIIGLNHPSAVVYPLIVIHKSKNEVRSKTAEIILKDMRDKSSILIKECESIIDELNRCALLLHEKWMEAIEESAKMYFETDDINGMINLLSEVHEIMNESPKTMNEMHFHQMYSAELNEAKSLLKDYLEYKNEISIKQAWDIYHSVLISMKTNFRDFHNIDLDNVSPLLANFQQSVICVPGIFRTDYPIVKISGFSKTMTVLNSKQHPKTITMFGSDGKQYMFLLKGHEDLRQDERAMQLFYLVNALLTSDVDTCDKNLFIKRFPVIALSNNTGLLGWIPTCDTLSSLIKEYRASNDICKDIELGLLFTKYNRFESSTFLFKLEVFKDVLDSTLGLDIYKIIWTKSKNSEVWLDRRTNYSRSLAVMSMVGYILGLGDRHPSNLMLDRKSGKILHIDFGDCFEVAMKREKFPEKVPFRLTRMLIKALEVSGIEGTFSITCENVMRVLRTNQDSLIAILTAFVHDPLINFRFLIPLILKKTRNISYSKHIKSTNVSESLNERDPEEIKIYKKITEPVEKKAKNKVNNDMEYMSYQKRRMGSLERQLYTRFRDREQKKEETEELNKIAKIVLSRIIDKLNGRDFSKTETLDFKQQVEKLIKQATSNENLCQSYLGWCPFW